MTDPKALASAAALRARMELEPVGGPGARIFPPTYASGPDDSSGQHPRHAFETHTIDGEAILRVLVDSPASQANRQEQALIAARRRGRIAFPDLKVDLSGTAAEQDELLVSELPHRLADAVVRDSLIEGVPFAESEFGRRIVFCRLDDLTPILEASPTTLLFGAWFSQWQLSRPLRLQRLTTSDIWAHDAVPGVAVGSRIDPLGLARMDIFATEDGGWTVDAEAAAGDVQDRPKLHPAKKTSGLVHGNILPEIRHQGIIAARYELTWLFSNAALRRLSFGGAPEERAARSEAAQTYLLTLGLVARVLAHEEGYSLRSGCDLLPTKRFTFDVLQNPLTEDEVTTVTLTSDEAIALFEAATEAARGVGFVLDGHPDRDPVLVPSKALARLIARSAEQRATASGAPEA